MDEGEQCQKAREDERWGQAQGWPCAEGVVGCWDS